MNVNEFDIASRQERVVAMTIILVMVGLGLGLLPFASIMNQSVPSFLPIVVTVAMVFALLTAYLLATQWRLLQHSSYGILSSAYFFVGMCLAGQAVFFPILAPIMATDSDQAYNATVWLGTIWHLGFPLFAILYAMLQSGLRFTAISVKTIGWVSLAAICAVYAIIQSQILPPVVEHGHYTDLFTTKIAYTIFGLNLGASTLMAIRTRGHIRQDLWLAVILLSFAIEVLVSLQGYARYSIGWYAGRMFMLNGVALMLIVLIHSLIRMSQHLQSDNRALNHVAQTDALTNLGNRRNFDEKLVVYERLTQRDGCPIALLLIDIDFFKQYNDTYGHPAGDKCLQRIAALLAQQVYRPLDAVARVGGEEFALLLPDTSAGNALMIAERLRTSIYQQRLTNEKGIDGRITVSVGVALLEQKSTMSASDLVSSADRALYEAKQQGRNRCVKADAPLPLPSVA